MASNNSICSCNVKNNLRAMIGYRYDSDHDFYEQLKKAIYYDGETYIGVCERLIELIGSGCCHGKVDVNADREAAVKRPEPEVFGADGVPIKVGETVYEVYDGGSAEVVKSITYVNNFCKINYESDGWGRPNVLIHTSPDTQERINDDIDECSLDDWLDAHPDGDPSTMIHHYCARQHRHRLCGARPRWDALRDRAGGWSMTPTDVSPLPQISFAVAFGSEADKVAESCDVEFDGKAGMAFIDDRRDEPVLVMLVRADGTREQTMALIAHEATHLAYRYFAILGDDSPSEESIAYAVDAFTYQAVIKLKNTASMEIDRKKEIVRCRDCKMWATELRYMGKCTGKDGKLNPNGYCAWGERRQDGEYLDEVMACELPVDGCDAS